MNDTEFESKMAELERCLERTNFWITNCDQKASMVLGFLGVFIALIFSSDTILCAIREILKSLWKSVTDHSYPDCCALIILIALAISLFLLGLSIKYLFDAITAKTDPGVFKENGLCTNSKLHYQSIVAIHFLPYKKSREERSHEDELNDYYSQIYINSRICTDKFDNYNRAIIEIKNFFIVFVAALILILIKASI